MKNVIARGVEVMAAAMAAAAMAMLGVADARADSPVNQKYSDARSIVENSGATPVLATVSGDQLALDDCIVTSAIRSSAVSALGERTGRRVLLNVNCNSKVAEAGVPGNSVMTPAGQKAKRWNSWAESIATNPTKFGCYKSDSRLADCKKVCDSTGKCDADSL